MVLDKVVKYDHHIFGAVLHIIPVVDIALGPHPLANNVHALTLNNHLFEYRVVGMELGTCGGGCGYCGYCRGCPVVCGRWV